MRTLKELATEAISLQDACNLSGLVHSWSGVIHELYEIYPTAGTGVINRHPITKLWADKVQSLAFGRECLCDECQIAFSKAYEACKDMAQM